MGHTFWVLGIEFTFQNMHCHCKHGLQSKFFEPVFVSSAWISVRKRRFVKLFLALSCVHHESQAVWRPVFLSWQHDDHWWVEGYQEKSARVMKTDLACIRAFSKKRCHVKGCIPANEKFQRNIHDPRHVRICAKTVWNKQLRQHSRPETMPFCRLFYCQPGCNKEKSENNKKLGSALTLLQIVPIHWHQDHTELPQQRHDPEVEIVRSSQKRKARLSLWWQLWWMACSRIVCTSKISRSIKLRKEILIQSKTCQGRLYLQSRHSICDSLKQCVSQSHTSE